VTVDTAHNPFKVTIVGGDSPVVMYSPSNESPIQETQTYDNPGLIVHEQSDAEEDVFQFNEPTKKAAAVSGDDVRQRLRKDTRPAKESTHMTQPQRKRFLQDAGGLSAGNKRGRLTQAVSRRQDFAAPVEDSKTKSFTVKDTENVPPRRTKKKPETFDSLQMELDDEDADMLFGGGEANDTPQWTSRSLDNRLDGDVEDDSFDMRSAGSRGSGTSEEDSETLERCHIVHCPGIIPLIHLVAVLSPMSFSS